MGSKNYHAQLLEVTLFVTGLGYLKAFNFLAVCACLNNINIINEVGLYPWINRKLMTCHFRPETLYITTTSMLKNIVCDCACENS